MIVFCHLLNDYSGSPRVLLNTLKAVSEKHQNLLFVGSHGPGILDNTTTSLNRYFYRRSEYSFLKFLNYIYSQFSLIYHLIKSREITNGSVVFVNTLLPFGAMLWGKFTGRKVIVHVHEVSIRPLVLRKFLTHVASKCASRLVYVSNDHLRRLPIKAEISTVIYNSIDSDIEAESILAPPYSPRRSGKFEVLMLASLMSSKGIEEFVQLSNYLRNRDDIIFKLVLNTDVDEFRRFKQSHSDKINLDIRPRTPDPSIYYATSDIVLNLSRIDEHIETFGLTIVEAMAFGVPVIVPPIGGPIEIVTDGLEGFHIDSRDVEAVARAVCLLADQPTVAIEMSRAARSRSNSFKFEKYAQGILSVLY